MKLRLLCMIGLAIFCVGPSAGAQTVSGTLQGHVVDQSGAVVIGTAITLKNLETGLERKTVTDEKGFFQLTFLPIGFYDVTASMTGFKTVTKQKVEIQLNSTTVEDFSITASGAQEVVTVTGGAAEIDKTSGEIKTTYDSQQVTERPIAGRSFLSLAETAPGFQESPLSGVNNPTLSTGSSVNFNGTGSRGSTFQIDGVNNDDSSENQNRQGVNLSAIRAFQLITNNFSAEFGRGYGAVVLVQTKSGGNRFNGEGFWFHQNSALNANNFFRNAAGRFGDRGEALLPFQKAGDLRAPIPPSRRHDWGGVFGGPIKRDKLFFFASIERVDNGGSLGFTEDILLPGERTPDPSVTDPANRAFIQSVIDRFPNIAPNNASAGSRAFTTTRLFSFPDTDYSGRIDWNTNSANNMFFRYQYSTNRRESQDVIIGEQALQDHRQQNLGYVWTHQFGPVMVGEFRFSVGRRRTIVDILAGNDTPVIRFSGTLNPSIIGNAGAFPIHRFQTDFQFVYNLSTVFNRHALKFGTDIRPSKLDDLADNFSRGFYTFSASGGRDAYGNFLRGFVGTFTKGYGPFFLRNRIKEFNFYAQDDFRVKPNFTLNIGARYEYAAAPVDADHQVSYGFADDADNIAPRIGFAYTPDVDHGFLAKITGGPGQSVIRGGGGLFYGRLFQSYFSQSGATVRFNPPNAALLSFTNTFNVADPTGGFVFVPGPPTARISPTFIDPNLQQPYTEQWNLTVERLLPWKMAAKVGYIGNHGVGLPFYDFDNRAEFPIVSPNHPFNAPFGGVLFNQIDANPNNTNPAAGIISRTQPRINQRRPDPRYSNVVRITNGAWSYYHALQASLQKKYSSGLWFDVAYTWSKATDTGSEATAPGAGETNAVVARPLGGRSNKALSRFDTRHRLTITYSYLLPFFAKPGDSLASHLLTQTLGGWQLSGVTTFASGNPFTVFSNFDVNADGIGGDRPDLINPSLLTTRSIDNGRGVAPVTVSCSGGFTQAVTTVSQQQLPCTAFGTAFRPGTANIGTLGRNTFFMHGINNWNIALAKRFRVRETQSLHFRAEYYNVFNRVQFGLPSTALELNTFGRITGQRNAARFAQMALRYIF